MNLYVSLLILCTSLSLVYAPSSLAQSGIGHVVTDWTDISEQSFLAGESHGTTISGFSSGVSGDILLSPNAYLLTIGGSERGDAPCQVRLRLSGEDGGIDTEEFNDCNGKPRSYQETRILQPFSSFAQRPWAIAGVEVCMNRKDNRRLKGVRISTVRAIEESGVVDVPNSEWRDSIRGEFERAHCSQWQPEALCAAGMVAWGTRVYHDADGVSGLSLICTPARFVPTAWPLPETYRLRDANATVTRVSGSAGTPRLIESDDPSYFALTTIDWGERGDKPCTFRTNFQHIRDPRLESPGAGFSLASHNEEQRLNVCGTDRDLQFHVDGLLPTGDFFVANSGENFGLYVHSIRACMNGQGDRVKGLRVGSTAIIIDADGGFSTERPTLSPSAYDRANHCDSWRRQVSCGERELAIGLVVHLAAGSEPRAATGVALKCAPFITITVR